MVGGILFVVALLALILITTGSPPHNGRSNFSPIGKLTLFIVVLLGVLVWAWRTPWKTFVRREMRTLSPLRRHVLAY
jgi:hypothetical protein